MGSPLRHQHPQGPTSDDLRRREAGARRAPRAGPRSGIRSRPPFGIGDEGRAVQHRRWDEEHDLAARTRTSDEASDEQGDGPRLRGVASGGPESLYLRYPTSKGDVRLGARDFPGGGSRGPGPMVHGRIRSLATRQNVHKTLAAIPAYNEEIAIGTVVLR